MQAVISNERKIRPGAEGGEVIRESGCLAKGWFLGGIEKYPGNEIVS